MFGEKFEDENDDKLFSSFLCQNDMSTQKKDQSHFTLGKSEAKSKINDVTKNILSEFDKSYDVDKVIKIQARYRQHLAQVKFKEYKQRRYISMQQCALASNKQKIVALRVISKIWILFKEARRMVANCKYLQDNNKDTTEEPYHFLCQDMKDLKYIESQFRKGLFRKVREYLKTTPYE